MKITGNKIRRTRLKKGMSQSELAKGACTQATISLIENSNHCSNIEIMEKICSKLNLELDEVVDLKSHGERSLIEVEDYIHNKEWQQALDRLKKINILNLESRKMKGWYDLCVATADFGLSKDADDAIYTFNTILNGDFFDELDYRRTLTMIGLGMAYSQKNQIKRAQTFFELAFDQLKAIMELKKYDVKKVTDTYILLVLEVFSIENFELTKTVADHCINKLIDNDKTKAICLMYLFYGFSATKIGDFNIGIQSFFCASELQKKGSFDLNILKDQKLDYKNIFGNVLAKMDEFTCETVETFSKNDPF